MTDSISEFSLVDFINQQKAFSSQTYGPGTRTEGVLQHIRKELNEIEVDPFDLEEWIDVLLLTFDATWRHGYTAEQVVSTLLAKLEKNINRTWPDWRSVPEGQAIEHVRSDEEHARKVFERAIASS